MDEMVLAVQEWLNDTYETVSGFTPIDEDGITGWGTIRGLTMALQIELGISPVDGSFGPQTMNACPTLSTSSESGNLVKIVQGALFCKGYDPTGFTGTYGNGTKTAISNLQSDAGLSNPDGITTPMIFKALLSMDAFVNLGDANIRTIQQNLNDDYSHVYGPHLGLIPCDGLTSKNLIRALIYALQIETNNPAPDGVWGPQTLSLIPTVSQGSTRTKLVYLLQYGLYLNNFDPIVFNGIFDATVKQRVLAFQEFCKLTADGIAGKQTFASLFISYGDKNRPGTACDCVTTITPERARTLYNSGYRYVGRYLVGDWKNIKPGELETIFAAGLRVFPIYQTSGNDVNYFTTFQGAKDAITATSAAMSYGFKTNTIIYFAVDFDCLDGQVTSHIIPYFRALNNTMQLGGGKYKIGIYGPRNVCSRVSDLGLAVTSFVSDMSSGFSGNLGYPLPFNWAIDQIATITIGSDAGQIEIDKNIYSGRDLCADSVEDESELPFDPELENQIFFGYIDEIYQLAINRTNGNVYDANQKVMQYIRKQQGYDEFIWTLAAGSIDNDFCDLVDATLGNTVEKLYDPRSGVEIDCEHMLASCNAFTYTIGEPLINELTSMIGDLITLTGECAEAVRNGEYLNSYVAAKALIAHPVEGGSTLSLADFLADVDAWNLGKMMNDDINLPINQAIRTYYTNLNYYNKRHELYLERYGSLEQLEDHTQYLINDGPLGYNIMRGQFIERFHVPNYSQSDGENIAQAFREYVEERL
ncbi:glycoside hydrolase domain-containing protein [Cohnella massiliensis]|uniref:glycoside hydrolase domain-containing protein n=1 Tax=Cohnella massiliensis TaxID=1816691 RepID=UPI0009BBDE73|nr:glycoside hydrolase domain-containing protein [Cohnella massiliensis]